MQYIYATQDVSNGSCSTGEDVPVFRQLGRRGAQQERKHQRLERQELGIRRFDHEFAQQGLSSISSTISIAPSYYLYNIYIEISLSLQVNCIMKPYIYRAYTSKLILSNGDKKPRAPQPSYSSSADKLRCQSV